VLATAHRLAAALHHVGAMDAFDMREMDRLCLPRIPTRTAARSAAVRQRER